MSSSLPNSANPTEPVVDPCGAYIEHLKACCFQPAVDDLNKQLQNGVISPFVHMSIHQRSANVNADMVLDENCQFRIDGAISDHIIAHAQETLPYGSVLIKQKRKLSLVRDVRVVQGATYFGTLLKVAMYKLNPFE